MVIVIILFHIKQSKADPLYEHVDEACSVSGKVSNISGSATGTDLIITLSDIEVKRGTPVSCNEKILVYCKSTCTVRSDNGEEHCLPDDIGIGNRITVSGSAEAFAHAGNPGQFDEYLYYRNTDHAYKIVSDNISITDGHYSFREYLRKIKERSVKKIYSY